MPGRLLAGRAENAMLFEEAVSRSNIGVRYVAVVILLSSLPCRYQGAQPARRFIDWISDGGSSWRASCNLKLGDGWLEMIEAETVIGYDARCLGLF